MDSQKHKNGKNHVIIVTSDAEDASVKQFRISRWFVQSAVIMVCVIIGAVLGYFIYEQEVWEVANQKVCEQIEIVNERELKIKELEELLKRKEEELLTRQQEAAAQIDSLNSKINILSETVNRETALVEQLKSELEKQFLPTNYPLTGSATMEEAGDKELICVFTATSDATVVATAGGTVIAINEDAMYGNNVWVDHGNGYVTIYRNRGKVNVKLGDSVSNGTTIYVIGDDNSRFGYQIMKDEVYIDPMTMLTING